MLIPTNGATTETIIKGSRFKSESFIVQSQQEVRDLIKSQKKRYPDATHVCHAFISGKNAEVMGMSDDGEPGGTAGRPMLDVLKGSGITNILVTVTRWFGGTLLGTGGLVHAYGDAVKSVLAETPTEELVQKSSFSLKCDYQQYQVIKKIFENFTVSCIAEDFAEEITISGQIPTSESDKFSAEIFEKTNGKVTVSLQNL